MIGDVVIIFLLVIALGGSITIFIFLRDMQKVLDGMLKRIEKMKEDLERKE